MSTTSPLNAPSFFTPYSKPRLPSLSIPPIPSGPHYQPTTNPFGQQQQQQPHHQQHHPQYQHHQQSYEPSPPQHHNQSSQQASAQQQQQVSQQQQTPPHHFQPFQMNQHPGGSAPGPAPGPAPHHQHHHQPYPPPLPHHPSHHQPYTQLPPPPLQQQQPQQPQQHSLPITLPQPIHAHPYHPVPGGPPHLYGGLIGGPGGGPGGANSESRRKTPSSWDPHDDLLLRHLKEQLKLGWKEIAAYFPNRTTNACQFRWRRLVSGTLRNSANTSGTGTPQSPGSNSPVISDNGETTRRSSSIGSNNGNPLQNYQASYEQNPNSFYYQPGGGPVPAQAAAAAAATAPSDRLWTKDQDELLRSRQDLRPEELSILLGVSEQEIKMRLDELDKPALTSSTTPTTTGSSTPTSSTITTTTSSSAPKSLANYQLSTSSATISKATIENGDNVTIVDQEQDGESSSGEDGVPRTIVGRSRAGSHPRPLLPRKLSGSHFDGLKLPVPVVQRPGSFSEGSPSSTAAATPTITPTTPATPVSSGYSA